MERTTGQGNRNQGESGKARLHNSQGKDRQHRHSEAGQTRGRAQGQEGSRETQQARHTHHAQQTESHGTQGKRGSGGTRQDRARQQGAGNTGQRAIILNMRHTETSNCAIVVAWQESERGRARQGSTPTNQLVERDSREAVSFVCFQTSVEEGHPASAAGLRYYPGPLRPTGRGRPGSSPDVIKNFFHISLRLP